jgi:hypothetical protein
MTSKSEQFRLNVQRGVKENENDVIATNLSEVLYRDFYIEDTEEHLKEYLKNYLDNRKEV